MEWSVVVGHGCAPVTSFVHETAKLKLVRNLGADRDQVSADLTC